MNSVLRAPCAGSVVLASRSGSLAGKALRAHTLRLQPIRGEPARPLKRSRAHRSTQDNVNRW